MAAAQTHRDGLTTRAPWATLLAAVAVVAASYLWLANANDLNDAPGIDVSDDEVAVVRTFSPLVDDTSR